MCRGGPQRGSVILCTLSAWLIAIDVDFDHLAEGMVVRLLCCKVIFSPLEEVTVYIPHSGSGELCSISVRKEELPNLFGSLLNGRFFSSLAFIYSIITLHHYGLQDICSIFWVVIACYLALWLKIFQHWSWQDPCVCSWVPWHAPIIADFFFFLENFLTFWYYKTLRAHLLYLLPPGKNLFVSLSAAFWLISSAPTSLLLILSKELVSTISRMHWGFNFTDYIFTLTSYFSQSYLPFRHNDPFLGFLFLSFF